MNLAVLENETLAYGTEPVLQNVSLSLGHGDRVALLGKSGAGKSTLLTTLYHRLTNAGRRVALVPQDLALVPQLNVVRNILMGRLDDHNTLYNLTSLVRPRASDLEDILAILEKLGLTGLETKPVQSLSGGQKQRVALARALHRGGDVVIADEPFSALDEMHRDHAYAALADTFPTMLIAMHDVPSARACANRIIGLKAGTIAFDLANEATTDRGINALYRG